MGIWRKSESTPVAAPALFALRGQDRRSLAATLERLVLMAPRLSDQDRQDLAAQWCREAAPETAAAAYEGPHSHVLGGPVASVRDLARRADGLGLAADVLAANHALHTPVMAPSVAPLRSVLGQFRFGSPRRRLVSTVTARPLTGQQDLAALLCAQLTSPVRFREALAGAADGAALLVMAAPDDALAAAAACSGVPVVSFTADGQGRGACAAALFVAGALPDVAALAPPPSSPPRDSRAPAGAAAPTTRVATVRGRFLETITALRPGAELRGEIRLSARTDPYLADYLVDGQLAFPAAMALEAMAQAASALTRQPMRSARHVRLGQPVQVAGDGDTRRPWSG